MRASPTAFGLLLAWVATAVAAPDPPVEAETDVEQLVRWGRIDDRQLDGPDRFRRYDEAIAITQPDADALAKTPGRALEWPAWNRLCNRLVALQERRRAGDAVALHDLLGRVPGRKHPLFVQASAASAWAELREPERAIPLFEEALSGYEPGSNDWGFVADQLAWALADAGRSVEMAERLDRWIAATPKRASAWLDLRLHRVQANLQLDRLDAAEAEAKVLQEQAPFNSSVREALAAVARARGWPRLGLEEARLAIAADPADLEDRVGEYDLLLDLGRNSDAYQTLDRARGRRPDAAEVRRARARWDLLHEPEVPLEASYTRATDSSPFGSQEWHVLAWGFTPPMRDVWRLFARVLTAGATFPDQTVTWQRGAVGAEWTPPDWRFRLDVAAGTDARPGGTLSGSWSPSDHLGFAAHVGTTTDAIPLQARRDGVLVDLDAEVEAAYAWSEATRVALTGDSLRFSDGNVRRSVLASLRQRLAGGAPLRIEGALYGSIGASSATGVGYFNPRRSASASAEATAVFRTWERLDRSFEQRLTISGGATGQADFGTRPAFGGRYHHAWRLGPAFLLEYGVSYTSNPYDGVQTRALGTYLTFDWRI